MVASRFVGCFRAQFAQTRLHTDRALGCHCDYRDTRRVALAGRTIRIFTVWLGCDRSSDVIHGELSEAARKSLFQKKVDVQDRSVGKSRVRNQGAKAPGQRPSS